MESEPSPSPRAREQRFREIYDAAYLDLLRFIRRRVHPSQAEDVAGDVMLVAWRRLDVASAWARLSASHQEAIALAVFDGLSAPEAASVLGITSVAYRLRLSRARRALRAHAEPGGRDDPAPSVPSERSLR